MKITIDQPSFNQLLNRCYPAVGVSTIPIIGNFYLEASTPPEFGGIEKLTVVATNLTVAIKGTADCKIKTAGRITLPAAKLRDIASRLPDGDVTIEVDERNAASIKCGKTRIKLGGMDAGAFPEIPSAPEALFEVGSALLLRMFSRAKISIPEGEAGRFAIPAGLMEIKGGELRIVGVDTGRMAIASTPFPGSEAMHVLMSPELMAAFIKLGSTESKARISHDDNHIFIEMGGTLIVGQKTDSRLGKFPAYDFVLSKMAKLVCATLNRDDLKTLIERVAPLADKGIKGENPGVDLRFTENQLTATTMGVSGDAEASIDVEYAGREIAYRFDSRFLMDFIGQAVTEKILFFVDDKERELGKALPASELRPNEDGYRYIIMPRHTK